jgi:hypothetical protein
MVFCRGCSKEIHESAPSCPQCGAIQTVAVKPNKESGWMSIVSAILAGFTFLGNLDFEGGYDRDVIVGTGILGVSSVILAAISLYQRKPLKTLAIVAITFTVLGLLILAGNSQPN